tara:strand:- start:1511 stop:1657 length:147 start_codon:yes stop_codon:yes gene_type:complete
MAKKEVKEVKEEAEPEPVKEEIKLFCTCRTEAGFRMNPPCAPGYGCLA